MKNAEGRAPNAYGPEPSSVRRMKWNTFGTLSAVAGVNTLLNMKINDLYDNLMKPPVDGVGDPSSGDEVLKCATGRKTTHFKRTLARGYLD